MTERDVSSYMPGTIITLMHPDGTMLRERLVDSVYSVMIGKRREYVNDLLDEGFMIVASRRTISSYGDRFNSIKDRLIAATGSPGLTSFHEGKVHMTLNEWDRLVTLIERKDLVS